MQSAVDSMYLRLLGDIVKLADADLDVMEREPLLKFHGNRYLSKLIGHTCVIRKVIIKPAITKSVSPEFMATRTTI